MSRSSEPEVVRQFSRTVVDRVGALNDRYLARDRPLSEARLLWTIGGAGPDGVDVAALRARLGLDSGYLSRLLRRLESDGLVETRAVAEEGRDQRTRRSALTPEGERECAVLDARSDELAESLLEPLTTSQRGRLVDAMQTVTRLLDAGAIELAEVDPDDPRAVWSLRQYLEEIDARFDVGYDPAAAVPTTAEAMRPPRGLFVLATLRGEPVGCGALKLHADGSAEVKRVWVSGAVRGAGLGRRLLRDLERRAVERGTTLLRLDTNATLVEAIALYRAEGWAEVPPFNDERYADHWFEKPVGPAAR